jgi:hypothetical protein
MHHAEYTATPMYTTTSTGVHYYMNTTPMDFDTAERMCNINGGHLATYGTDAEQREVEQHFLSANFFIPSCHQAYWIGYKATTWPNITAL